MKNYTLSHYMYIFSWCLTAAVFILRWFRGVALSHRSELQQVLERRKRVQSDQEEEQQSKTPLDDVLLRRQQKQHEVCIIV